MILNCSWLGQRLWINPYKYNKILHKTLIGVIGLAGAVLLPIGGVLFPFPSNVAGLTVGSIVGNPVGLVVGEIVGSFVGASVDD